jgi:hypothetical protein
VLEDPRAPEARELVALAASDLCRICSSLPPRATWYGTAEPEALERLTKQTRERLECPRCHTLYRLSSDGKRTVHDESDETWTLERLAAT